MIGLDQGSDNKNKREVKGERHEGVKQRTGQLVICGETGMEELVSLFQMPVD